MSTDGGMPIMPLVHGRDVSRITPIPWDIILPHERQAQKNHYQSLERLAERGGLGLDEAIAILEDRPWHKMDEIVALERLSEIIRKATADLPQSD
jgi:hypothetical protein